MCPCFNHIIILEYRDEILFAPLTHLPSSFSESIEEFEHSIMQKKMKIPKMSNRNTVENHFGEERMPLRHKKVGLPIFKKGFKIWRHLQAFRCWSGFVDGEHVDRLGMAQQGFSADIKSVFYTLQTKQGKNIRTCFDAYGICPDISNVSSLFCLICQF